MKPPFHNVYDISVTLGRESIDYPGDTKYRREQLASFASGDVYNLSTVHMSSHAGTHLDAPSHFVANGKTIDDFPVNRFIFHSLVVEIPSHHRIEAEAIGHLNPEPGSALLFKTQNSISGLCRSGTFSEQFVYLTPGAAQLCADWRLGLVGIDYISLEKFGDSSFQAHRRLLGKEILVLEGIDLASIDEGEYTLICMPLKLHGAEGSPTRAILLKQGE